MAVEELGIKRRKWVTPELIVLIREIKDTALITWCKFNAYPPGRGPNVDQCMDSHPKNGQCHYWTAS